MRLLIVARADSVHTTRWISQIADRGWDVHLFPGTDSGTDIHPGMRNVVLHHSGFLARGAPPEGVAFRGDPPLRRIGNLARRRLFGGLSPGCRAARLSRLVETLRPDVVHSMEMQAAGYLTREAKRLLRGRFPPWIVTNWGSDIYLFGRQAEHEPKIRDVLGACDYYSCECLRDVALAKTFGFRGTVFPVIPSAGGFDLAAAAALRRPGRPSARRTIVLKGYQHWAGRALVGLRALSRCADALAGYEVAVYSASPDVAAAAGLFGKETGIPVRIVPKGTPHAGILRLHGQARLSVAVSASDGLPASLLETMIMGSFPIQSWTACADEWIEHGATGLLVPPDDPDAVAAAIRRALGDDGLVDGAAEKNARVAAERLDAAVLASRAADMYRRAAGGTGAGR